MLIWSEEHDQAHVEAVYSTDAAAAFVSSSFWQVLRHWHA